MTIRNVLALLVAMLLVDASLAQEPPEASNPPPVVTESTTPTTGLATATPSAPMAYSDVQPFAPDNQPGAWWASGAYFMGWLQHGNTPPLVTTGPAVPMTDAGVIGAAGTGVLFGGAIDEELRSGGRFEVGYWFARDLAISVGVFFIDENQVDFAAASDGAQVLARPFVDAQSGQNEAQLVAFPGELAGSIRIDANSLSMYGTQVNLRERFYDDGVIKADSILGYRMINYAESLQINADFTTLAGAAPGTRVRVFDTFNTTNHFHAVDMGFRVEMQRQRWSLELLGKYAVGNLHRRVSISGNTVITAPGQDPVQLTGGLLALRTNIGRFTRSDWEAVPELGITIGWNATNNICLKLGYAILHMEDIARAGDQIDETINQTLIPQAVNPPAFAGPERPAVFYRRTDLLLQTLNFGLECRY